LAGVLEYSPNWYPQYAAFSPPWSKPSKFFPESPNAYIMKQSVQLITIGENNQKRGLPVQLIKVLAIINESFSYFSKTKIAAL